MYVRNEALVEKAWFKKNPLCHVFFFTPIGRFSCSCQLFCFFFQAAGRSLCQPQWMKWEVLDVQSLFTCPSKPWLWKNGDPYTFTQSGVRSSLPSLGERTRKKTHTKLSNTPHPSQTKKTAVVEWLGIYIQASYLPRRTKTPCCLWLAVGQEKVPGFDEYGWHQTALGRHECYWATTKKVATRCAGWTLGDSLYRYRCLIFWGCQVTLVSWHGCVDPKFRVP